MKISLNELIKGNNPTPVFEYVLHQLFQKGPISIGLMEIITYLFLFHSDQFNTHKRSILNFMGLYFKNTVAKNLKEVIFEDYKNFILELHKKSYTPVQSKIIRGIESSSCFSFSAPTSTGKSFVFLNKILEINRDVVIVVPSRALINEFYIKVSSNLPDKSINVLTFIDKINTAHAKRNIFIVTPERCRELFRQKSEFSIELFLFDEAQLADEDSKRGLYFDSIVRRCQKAYPDAKFVFSHPFVENPDSQILRNNFDINTSKAMKFEQKNIGQIFLCQNLDSTFDFFAVDKENLGNRRVRSIFDPIQTTISSGGSVLIYVSKAKIYNKSILKKFSKYIEMCSPIESEAVDQYIEKMKKFTGGDTKENENHYSLLLSLLKRGIVIHHGSLPLQTRLLIEQFTKEGFCRICFATSTLEQGINMPFDVVFLDRLEKSKPLSVKNIIGRAGRSSVEDKFDFGFVIVAGPSRINDFRYIMTHEEHLDNVSLLEKESSLDEDYKKFKDAIVNGTFSDEFNLSQDELNVISNHSNTILIERILNSIFKEDEFISLREISSDSENRLSLYQYFIDLYISYLGRHLSPGEVNVFNTAIKIILWKVHGKTFKNICWYRYSYASKSNERREMERRKLRTSHLKANFITGYSDLPDKKLHVYPLFPNGTKAVDVDYDLIMYDTYDFIDKLISFKLVDILYAYFFKHFERSNDNRSLRLAKYIKYATDDERHIWMLKYGLSFEEIEIFDEHIEEINESEIVFKRSIFSIDPENRITVEKFINKVT